MIERTAIAHRDCSTWPSRDPRHGEFGCGLLRTGLITLGRDPACDVFLDMYRVQELRLVSGQHAYLHCSSEAYRLFDGSPSGQRSINGTFVNNRPVPASGQLLRDGDLVILAAVRPQAPSLDTPGVVGLRFRARCE